MKMGHFIYYLVPLRAPHSPFTKGGGVDISGEEGEGAPGRGCNGVEAPCLLKFGISELNLCDLVHIVYPY